MLDFCCRVVHSFFHVDAGVALISDSHSTIAHPIRDCNAVDRHAKLQLSA